MVRLCKKSDKTVLSPDIFAESRCYSSGCMAMHSGEIYQAQAARFIGEFIAGFARLTPHPC